MHSRERGTGRRPGPPVHDDLVTGGVGADAPNQLWLTDLTEHPTAEGKLYLCAVKDACSKRIVGYSMDARRTSRPAVDALRHPVAPRRPVDTVVHSDRGSQVRPTPTSTPCAATGSAARWAGSGRTRTTPRWSRSPRCCTRTSRTAGGWQTREQLRPAIAVRIERTHHRRRRRDTLGRPTPIEFETLLQTAHPA
ncbi:MAG: Integrase catalytic region [Cryptosporangiaceae bacterium]|nr:Integrase catalytic region [Cryptosporangiaceae bacterium]